MKPVCKIHTMQGGKYTNTENVEFKDIYEKVGKFDECFFPAYYEDKSYEYRMKLKNIPVLTHPTLNPIIYRSSQSIEKDYSILTASKKNKKLFRSSISIKSAD